MRLILTVMRDWRGRRAAIRRRRQAIAELEQLSDHRLRGLGFTREQVAAMKAPRAW